MTDLIKVEEFTTLIQSAPDALSKNQKSISACNSTGQGILDTIEGEGMSDELDAQAAEYLKKVNITIKNMQSRRAPITQIFDRIRSVFTSDEKAIDPKDGKTIPGKIAYARDQYAALKRFEEKKRQEEALRKANIENEKVTYRSSLETGIQNHMNSYFADQSKQLSDLWSQLTLNSFDLKAKIIREWSLDYPLSHFNTFTKDYPTYYIDAITKGAIKADVFRGKYEKYVAQYRIDMDDLRQSFIDRLLSKKKELQEIETLKLQDQEAANSAEEQRKLREQEEQRQRELEQKKKEEEALRKRETDMQTAQMSSLFDSAAATVNAPSPVKVKATEKIKVLHPAAFLEIYQMWWMNEGQGLTIEELEKIHKKMIAFCEKKANKDDVRIQSKYIRYEEDVKAK
ncbi:hypothetical protein [Bacteroides sp. AF16-49]|uniref:hypothetical protein n=1 Tax=Bacteroides sp. AF16-49 TaxID=2292192 RepID=UPI001F2DD168|nr:hypothetical protein [Bacteroides sp. AF16-49]